MSGFFRTFPEFSMDPGLGFLPKVHWSVLRNFIRKCEGLVYPHTCNICLFCFHIFRHFFHSVISYFISLGLENGRWFTHSATSAHMKYKIYTGRENICRAGVYFLFSNIKAGGVGGIHYENQQIKFMQPTFFSLYKKHVYKKLESWNMVT